MLPQETSSSFPEIKIHFTHSGPMIAKILQQTLKKCGKAKVEFFFQLSPLIYSPLYSSTTYSTYCISYMHMKQEKQPPLKMFNMSFAIFFRFFIEKKNSNCFTTLSSISTNRKPASNQVLISFKKVFTIFFKRT